MIEWYKIWLFPSLLCWASYPIRQRSGFPRLVELAPIFNDLCHSELNHKGCDTSMKNSTVQTLLWDMRHEQAEPWNYAITSLDSLTIPPHCGPLLFHRPSSLSWIAFMSLREKLNLLWSPTRIEIWVCITSMTACSNALRGDAEKKLHWLLVDSGDMFSLSTKMHFSSTSIWSSDRLYLSFCLLSFSAVSQIPINNPNTQTDMNNLMGWACQTKCPQCAF